MESVSPGSIRVTHEERRRAAEVLSSAFTDGCLTMSEFESRTTTVYAAVTRGEHGPLTADLPARLPDIAALRRSGRRRARGRILRDATTIWWLACVVSVMIWGLVCLGNDQIVDPWWIWVLGPAGALLATLWRLFDREE